MSQKSKYSLEARLLAVRSVLEDNLSFRQAGGLIGAGHRQVRWWVAHYRAYGKKALAPCGRVPYSLSFKLRILEDIQTNGLSLLDASLKYRVPSQSTLCGWLYRYKKDGEKAFLMEKKKEKNRPYPCG
ncbi:MAG: hypothetical protein LUD02_13835 [Tannerellaceae bacterium]|nr:hypothetical protein [Tannerellaceae bacterium]MCD8265088.1 hypothetical protein [Tannerellaceae bacterium]